MEKPRRTPHPTVLPAPSPGADWTPRRGQLRSRDSCAHPSLLAPPVEPGDGPRGPEKPPTTCGVLGGSRSNTGRAGTEELDAQGAPPSSGSSSLTPTPALPPAPPPRGISPASPAASRSQAEADRRSEGLPEEWTEQGGGGRPGARPGPDQTRSAQADGTRAPGGPGSPAPDRGPPSREGPGPPRELAVAQARGGLFRAGAGSPPPGSRRHTGPEPPKPPSPGTLGRAAIRGLMTVFPAAERPGLRGVDPFNQDRAPAPPADPGVRKTPEGNIAPGRRRPRSPPAAGPHLHRGPTSFHSTHDEDTEIRGEEASARATRSRGAAPRQKGGGPPLVPAPQPASALAQEGPGSATPARGAVARLASARARRGLAPND
nr:collagen alpha-1(III) chain-like [Dasypus novemcinctus]